MTDDLEREIRAGAITALRKRAAAQRDKAQIARASECETHRRLAKLLASIADELEAEARA